MITCSNIQCEDYKSGICGCDDKTCAYANVNDISTKLKCEDCKEYIECKPIQIDGLPCLKFVLNK